MKRVLAILPVLALLLLTACPREAEGPENGTICWIDMKINCVVKFQKVGNSCECDGRPGYVRAM